MNERIIKAGIVGGTGYTGMELLRLLLQHPGVKLNAVTSRARAGEAVADVLPNLRSATSLAFTSPHDPVLAECDVVFFATPHGSAMAAVPPLLEAGVRVVDLGADFRLRDARVWEQWYGMTHSCPELLRRVVYGLPELYRDAIRSAALVANPGCYPTATILGFLPLLQQRAIDAAGLIADAKSGVSGAGRKAVESLLYCETSDNFKAYGLSGHRHLPEIEQVLGEAASGAVEVTFVPHLTPMVRGLHATLYGRLNEPTTDVQALFEGHYAGEPCVDVLPPGLWPETRTVKGTNLCRLAVHREERTQRVVVVSVIDNLVKGAAGQAVQNMNIMFGFEEALGLQNLAVLP